MLGLVEDVKVDPMEGPVKASFDVFVVNKIPDGVGAEVIPELIKGVAMGELQGISAVKGGLQSEVPVAAVSFEVEAIGGIKAVGH